VFWKNLLPPSSGLSAVCSVLLQNATWCCIQENHNLNVKNWINYVEKYFKICVVSFTDNRIIAGCMVISVLLVIFQFQIFWWKIDIKTSELFRIAQNIFGLYISTPDVNKYVCVYIV
jgi:hypothetical protein